MPHDRRATENRKVTCPLCLSDLVRVVARTETLLICACDECTAQFTIMKPDQVSRL